MTGTFRPGRRLACVALLAALPLTACAAGYQAETSRVRTSLTSISAAKGQLTLRNVYFVGPAEPGGTLPLYMAVFNGGTTDDQLVSVSSTEASGGSVPASNAIPGGGQLFYNEGDAFVPQLTGLKQKVLVGQTVDVTLDFAQTGELRLTVPVEAAQTDAQGNPLPGPSPTPSASPSVTASPSAAAAGSASPSPSSSP